MSLMATHPLLTRDDLDALPDDGLRHELIDGAFVMTPAPGYDHQAMLGALYRALWSAGRSSGLSVIVAPYDVVLGPNVVEPDLLVAPSREFTQRALNAAPLLAVEIRSPSTRWLDEGRKRELYEEHGVASYWLVDPEAPSIVVLELAEGHYAETAVALGDETIELRAPFPISLNPATLAKG